MRVVLWLSVADSSIRTAIGDDCLQFVMRFFFAHPMALVSWIPISKSSQSNLVDIKLTMSTLVSVGLLLRYEPRQ